MSTTTIDTSPDTRPPEFHDDRSDGAPGADTAQSAESHEQQSEHPPRHRRAPLPTIMPVAGTVKRNVLEQLAETHPIDAEQLGEALIRGQRALDADDRVHLAELVNEGVRTLTPALATTDKAVRVKAETALKSRVSFVCRFVARREGEIARRKYAVGLGLGVAFTAVVLALVGYLAPVVIRSWLHLTHEGADTVAVGSYNWLALRDTLVAIAGGAAGAAVSVLLRLKGIPDLKVETVRASTAIVRILLGWFFALAFLALVKSGIAADLFHDPSATLLDADLTNDTPAVIVSSWFFWAAVGFLAGFNERWARTIIARDPAAKPAKEDQTGIPNP